ncbi:MAG TPA: VIT1/CCC1 transporter family protein [Ilumatobacteraceae bacterium]|jgi:VIT1/CCC1 family predicted Fe2+/Mn2+ transporter|nr:VIT1/CCC1 transporter family protein [Ilumatobacteraceae bacterium]
MDASIARPTQIRIEPRVSDAESDTAALRRKADQVQRGGARAAVLGVNDGLVTNLCLILGIAGASASASSVRLAGFASLIAGAFSMAAGEWVSVRSQAQMAAGLVGELKRLISRNPRLVMDELTNQLIEDGFGAETARKASAELPLDEERFLNFTSRTIFGVNPDELGSPLIAASSSLALFSVGALVPLLPWFFSHGNAAVTLSVLLTAIASLLVGGLVSWTAGNSAVRGGVRQLLIVVLASAVTYGIGSLFGTVVA